jgi:hypothetical protein
MGPRADPEEKNSQPLPGLEPPITLPVVQELLNFVVTAMNSTAIGTVVNRSSLPTVDQAVSSTTECVF